MDELVKLVSEKTGLPEKQAEQAAKVVIDFLKDKLPDPIGDQLDNVIEGGDLMDGAGGLLKGLGGMFNK